MKTEGEALRLRAYVNESDRIDGRPVYEAIIRAAKDLGLSGATALRGIEGYGVSGRVHTVKVLHLSDDVPIVVEILDAAERIAKLLPVLDTLVAEGAISLEKIHLVTYRRDVAPDAEVQFDDEIQLESEPVAPVVKASAEAEPFTDNANQVFAAARESATESRRAYVDSVDVLLAMLCEKRGLATKALKHAGMDCKSVERSLRETVNRDEDANAFLRALKSRSRAAAKWLGDDYQGAEHLLLALCQVRPSAATDILTRLGAQPRDICQEVLNLVGHEDDWQRWLADHPEL
jgi:PII-like signaling protein